MGLFWNSVFLLAIEMCADSEGKCWWMIASTIVSLLLTKSVYAADSKSETENSHCDGPLCMNEFEQIILVFCLAFEAMLIVLLGILSLVHYLRYKRLKRQMEQKGTFQPPKSKDFKTYSQTVGETYTGDTTTWTVTDSNAADGKILSSTDKKSSESETDKLGRKLGEEKQEIASPKAKDFDKTLSQNSESTFRLADKVTTPYSRFFHSSWLDASDPSKTPDYGKQTAHKKPEIPLADQNPKEQPSAANQKEVPPAEP